MTLILHVISATKIDTSIHTANEEVNTVREELVYTNRRLNEMCDVTKLQDISSVKSYNAQIDQSEYYIGGAWRQFVWGV